MSDPEGTSEQPNWSDSPYRIELSKIEFPSDALSIKRFRVLYPKLFDERSTLNSGSTSFFEPDRIRSPHLEKLNDLLTSERTVADYAFFSACSPESLDDECHEDVLRAKELLEGLYQEFKLADGPAMARLLIHHLEEQGAAQGAQVKGPSR